jgi:phosphohistidine phosphatase
LRNGSRIDAHGVCCTISNNMDLILWRHCEAEDATSGQDDLSRILTPRGEKQARKVARWFLERRPKELRILVSPAERTVQTAQALKLSFATEPRIGPGASVSDLIAVSEWPTAKAAMLVIGHQPTLGQFAALLLSGKPADWNMKKGAMWWFSSQQAQTTLRAVATPDLV